jgi:hypothetical protein
LYEKRQQLLDLGPDALTLLTALLHRAPTRGTEHTERLYALYQEHGERAMRIALMGVVHDDTLTLAALMHALDGLARTSSQPPTAEGGSR